MKTKIFTSLVVFFASTSLLFADEPNFFNHSETDFYSQIDDAGNTMANMLTSRHLKKYPTYQGFGKECRNETPWLDTEPLNEKDLQGNLVEFLGKTARKKNKKLDIGEMNQLATCLQSTYQNMQTRAVRQQDDIIVAGSYGSYMDGSLKNSDYDIIDDINKINKIIFKDNIKYLGTSNLNQTSLLDFLKGGEVKELSDGQDLVDPREPPKNTTTLTETTVTTTTPAISDADDKKIPWNEKCSDEKNTNTADTGLPGNLLDSNFTTELEHTLNSTKNTTNGGVDNSQNGNGKDGKGGNGKEKEKKDFYDKLPCNKIFCVTIDMEIGKGSFKSENDKSIEAILDKHMKMMEPIANSDLSAQKMTNNSFQLPFLNIKIADKVAGGRVFVNNRPQQTKKFKEEDTEEKRNAFYDATYRCAMIEAGLSPEKETNGGPDGGGYASSSQTNLSNITNTELNLTAKKPSTVLQNKNIQTTCGNLRTQMSKARRETAFATNFNEIYAFTNALSKMIANIAWGDTKLDSLKPQ